MPRVQKVQSEPQLDVLVVKDDSKEEPVPSTPNAGEAKEPEPATEEIAGLKATIDLHTQAIQQLSLALAQIRQVVDSLPPPADPVPPRPDIYEGISPALCYEIALRGSIQALASQANLINSIRHSQAGVDSFIKAVLDLAEKIAEEAIRRTE